jgi:hypothetical protein
MEMYPDSSGPVGSQGRVSFRDLPDARCRVCLTVVRGQAKRIPGNLVRSKHVYDGRRGLPCQRGFRSRLFEDTTMKNTSLAVICLFLGACAVGNKHEYSGPGPEMIVPSSNSVAVGVHDQRPYVVSGDKTGTFVGLTRGGFGNPFDVTTASGNPLADDFRATIAQVFKRNGVSVKEIAIQPTESASDARQALITLGQARSLLLTLTEWKSGTSMRGTFLTYDVHLVVLDSGGKALADKTLRGSDDLGRPRKMEEREAGDSSATTLVGHAKEVIPRAYKKKLEELLTSTEIKQALQ